MSVGCLIVLIVELPSSSFTIPLNFVVLKEDIKKLMLNGITAESKVSVKLYYCCFAHSVFVVTLCTFMIEPFPALMSFTFSMYVSRR